MVAAILVVIVYAFISLGGSFKASNLVGFAKDKFSKIIATPTLVPTPTAVPLPTPTPTPRPLTFAELNNLYGPCVHLPVLMYHHIQSEVAAKADRQTALTVYTSIFQTQMQYLKSKGYNTATMADLINFFDTGATIAPRSVLLTFDDGYQDFYTDAYPILSGLGMHATMFVPTGLMENPDYLTWGEISGMNGNILFGNHTWSHKNVSISNFSVVQKEISTADLQLADHGLDSPKVFAYPYGPATSAAESYLNSLGYKVAFTTTSGSILCKKMRFDLPRIRIGNAPLSNYGF